jgi:hypothetical protein
MMGFALAGLEAPADRVQADFAPVPRSSECCWSARRCPALSGQTRIRGLATRIRFY